MKKNLAAFGLACLVLLSSINVFAGDIIRPPENLKSLFGKTVTIENMYGPGTFYCHVTGVSDYLASMGREITLSVSGLNYNGEQIGTVSYSVSSPGKEMWHIIYSGHLTEVRLLSIE